MDYSWPGNIRQLENADRARRRDVRDRSRHRRRRAAGGLLAPGQSSIVPTVTIPDEGINFTSVVSQLERELILRCSKRPAATSGRPRGC